MFTGVIDGITGLIANAGPTVAPMAAEETASVLPWGLIEWNERDTIRCGYPSTKMDQDYFVDSFLNGLGTFLREDFFWELGFLSPCIVFEYAVGDKCYMYEDLYFCIELCKCKLM